MDSWGKTGIEMEKFTFRWDLVDYSAICNKRVVKSPTFYGGQKSRHRWYLEIRPQDEFVNFGIYLYLDAFTTVFMEECIIQTSWNFTLMDQNLVPLEEVEKRCIPMVEYTNYRKGRNDGVRANILKSDVRRLVAALGDNLTIFCEFVIYGKLTQSDEVGWTNTELSDVRKHEDLLVDFKSLRSSGLLSDVELCTENTPGTKKFAAHKNILACRSPVFSRMFQANMSESVTNIVIIPDFNDSVVEAMLRHIYGEAIDDFDELAIELLQIAEKYQLLSLKSECGGVMSSNLKVGNAVATFKLASVYNAPELKRNAAIFICSHKNDVAKTEEFGTLSREAITELFMADFN